MKRKLVWHDPVNLVPTALLIFTIFLPLVYSKGQFSISVWQLFVPFVLSMVFIKRKLAGDNAALFWLSIFVLLSVAILQPFFLNSREFYSNIWVLYISQLLVFFILAFSYSKNELFFILSRFAVISALLVAGVMIVQFATGTTFGNPRSYFGAENPASVWRFGGIEFIRPLGTLDNPNISGAFLLISLPFVFYFYGMFRKASLMIAAVLMALAIILTMSRGIILGLLVLVLSFFWGRYGWLFLKVIGSRLGLISLTVFLPAILFVFISGGYLEPLTARFEILFDTSGDGEELNRGSADFRFLMIWIGFLAGFEHPFLGVGLGGSAYILSDYSSLVPEWWQHRIHAFAPALFAEAGAVSGIIWLSLQLTALYRSFKCVRYGDDSYARAIFAANAVGFYLSWFYMTLYTMEFGAIYFIILLLGIKSRCVRSMTPSWHPSAGRRYFSRENK